MKAESQRHICAPMAIAALFTIAKTWKQPKCPPTDEEISKMWHTHIIDYVIQPLKEENCAICYIEGTMLNEVSQS